MATSKDTLLSKAPGAGTDRPVLDETTGKTTSRKAAPAKKAAAKRAPAKKGAAKATDPKGKAKAAPKAKAASGTKVTRNKLGKTGWLQEAILKVCTDFADGKVDTEGKPLTPHRIAKLVEAAGNPLPSSGAVAACLARWDEYGFAVLNEKPVAFKRFTPAGKKKGLETMVAEHRTAAWAARKG